MIAKFILNYASKINNAKHNSQTLEIFFEQGQSINLSMVLYKTSQKYLPLPSDANNNLLMEIIEHCQGKKHPLRNSSFNLLENTL